LRIVDPYELGESVSLDDPIGTIGNAEYNSTYVTRENLQR